MPTSVQQQIEDAVVRYILAANISDINNENVSVVRRQMPELLDKDPPRCCIVVVGNERMPTEAQHDKRTNVTNIFEYPALVVVTDKKALTQPKPDLWLREARYAIRNVLFRQFLLSVSLTDLGVVRRCRYIPDPEVNTVGFQRDVKVSGQMFLYRAEEARTA